MEQVSHICSSTITTCIPEVQKPRKRVLQYHGNDEQLRQAAQAALSSGAAPSEVFALIYQAYEGLQHPVPRAFELLLLHRGLHPNTPLPLLGMPYLHWKLNGPRPPPVSNHTLQQKSSSNDVVESGEGDQGATLLDLLSLGPNPDLQGPQGGTALHLLVGRLLSRCYFLPEEDSHMSRRARKQCSEEGWDQAAEYLTSALPLMLEAGFAASTPDSAGRTVIQMLRDGYLQYRRAASITHRTKRKSDCRLSEGQGRLADAIEQALSSMGEPLPVAADTAVAGHATAPAHVPKIGFGMHKDRRVTDIDKDYISWLCKEYNKQPAQSPLGKRKELMEAMLQLEVVQWKAGEEERLEAGPTAGSRVRPAVGMVAGAAPATKARGKPSFRAYDDAEDLESRDEWPE
mmetsp:Transcript_15019/g.32535  ORF Transcript_15019/g.32535 Transcript_15019/m.32535 type:complete len:401 (+) Transcript_15019:327-1529(+)|eukprot:CAMPEP_0202919834 /NCGR_PEP_ID=MMETSP1392-20130828/76538_1 /ASSEMBLY_ACC=CAM_ASM_000868 /TAXON_ID=225041 /ORGANISM="Chlamydomonas chlamydogama, Strain SAG 11-48b" /LENGTH=400 /DNA_ID=CAMNT_0049613295 /DNA_START=803 /DNA_END=2005 /DNA_ORIENTATION=-